MAANINVHYMFLSSLVLTRNVWSDSLSQMGVVQIVQELVDEVEEEIKNSSHSITGCDMCMGQIFMYFYPRLKESLPKMETIP